MRDKIKAAKEALMGLQARYQRAADDLAPAIQALTEAEETAEWAADRADGLEKARTILTPEALRAMDLSEAAPARAKPRRSPLRDMLGDGDPWS